MKPNGHVELVWQPNVIRHSTIRSMRPDVRSVHLSFDAGDLRVSVELKDARQLVRELEHAIEWAEDD